LIPADAAAAVATSAAEQISDDYYQVTGIREEFLAVKT